MIRSTLRILPAAGFALAALGCTAPAAEAPKPAAAAAAAVPAVNPLASFETVRAVLQSPRCLACHPAGDVPTVGDKLAPHSQSVTRGAEGRGTAGLECASCHGKKNPPDSYGASMPPGVSSEWRMPGAGQKMVFAGVAPGALCAQLKDPQQNGGKDLKALVAHVSTDPVVLWGWAPGFGRKPVAIAHADFVEAFALWAGAGAPCPK